MKYKQERPEQDSVELSARPTIKSWSLCSFNAQFKYVTFMYQHIN